MIKVSVILTIHDDGQFLPECMNSLCRQTLKDIEIICINDASTDNSADVLKYYAARDRRIKVINQNNIGPAACRNWGIVAAQGQYISLLEACDWVDPSFCEKLYDAASAENADIACCSLIHIDEASQAEPALKYVRKQTAKTLTQKFKLLHIPQFNYIYNKIYKRDFINGQELYFGEDSEYANISWCTQTAKKSEKIVSVPGVFYYHRLQEIIRPLNESEIKKSKDALIDTIIKNKIHVKIPYAKKTKIRVLGMPIIKILTNTNYKRYYLFGIKIIDVRSTRKF